MPHGNWTNEEKLACVERELRYRRRVYQRRVEAETMTPEQMQREVSLMEAIRDDYQKLAAGERLPL
jgi:hypothetical protein